MFPTYLPLKPKLFKRYGAWCIVVPDVVFGDMAVGAHQGPFPDFEIAFGIATRMSLAFLHNTELRHNQPIDIARVD